MNFALWCLQGLDGAPYQRFDTLVKQFQKLVSENALRYSDMYLSHVCHVTAEPEGIGGLYQPHQGEVMWVVPSSSLTLLLGVSTAQGNPEKQSNLPKDGTVHELTSHVSCRATLPPSPPPFLPSSIHFSLPPPPLPLSL